MIHIVWIPKYRKRILKDALAERIKELLHECADFNRWKIEELNIQVDHVHLLIQFRPDASVSRMVQLLKGRSAKIVRAEFPHLEEFYWGPSFWADGFFCRNRGST